MKKQKEQARGTIILISQMTKCIVLYRVTYLIERSYVELRVEGGSLDFSCTNSFRLFKLELEAIERLVGRNQKTSKKII